MCSDSTFGNHATQQCDSTIYICFDVSTVHKKKKLLTKKNAHYALCQQDVIHKKKTSYKVKYTRTKSEKQCLRSS